MWFRRDLRAYDHAALSRALEHSRAVYCVFVFDTEILDALSEHRDRRVEFIWHSVHELGVCLREMGGALWVLHGRARDEVPALALRLQVQAVYTNRDYEPAALERDRDVQCRLFDRQIDFHSCKDQVIFECAEVLTQGRRPFSVFTPYKQAWLAQLRSVHFAPHAVEQHAAALTACQTPPIPSLESMGFQRTNLAELGLPTGSSGAKAWLTDFLGRIDRYHERRDYPAVRGPSYLSVHLRFGTLSIRELVRAARQREGAGRADLAVGADLARLLFHDSVSPPARGESCLSCRARSNPLRESTKTISKRGAKRAPAIHWSTRRCARSTRPATCTIACAW